MATGDGKVGEKVNSFAGGFVEFYELPSWRSFTNNSVEVPRRGIQGWNLSLWHSEPAGILESVTGLLKKG